MNESRLKEIEQENDIFTIEVITELIAMVRSERADKEALSKFAARCMESWPDGAPGPMDGGELQEIAVECGLLVEKTMTEPCDEDCQCAEYGVFPQTCFRPTPLYDAIRKESPTS